MNSNTATETEKLNEQPVKKIVIRRLPPTLTKEQFLDIVSPLPEYDFFYFCNADPALGQYAFSRAYICFKNHQDVFNFRDRFDNYVFLDSKSNEYPALVEYAPFQRRFKIDPKNPPKKDSKCNTIHEDSDYLQFLENFGKPSEEQLPSCEAILEELEQKEKENLGPFSAPKVTTPLLEFLKRKKDEKRSAKDRDRDRRRRERDDDKRYGSGYSGKRRDDFYYGHKSKDQTSGSQNQTHTKITLAPKSEFKPEMSTKSAQPISTKPNTEKPSVSKNSIPPKEKERSNKSNYGYRGYGGYGSKNYEDKPYKEKNSTPSKNVENKPAKEKDPNEKEGQKPVRNKDRPSIQIYNPGQRASMKQQKL